MHLLNADLHSHSDVSDGTLSPQALAQRAHAQGVELWALTDHDELGGLAAAREAALDLGMGFLTGCEISVSFAGETVHVVGLGFDAGDAALAAGLAGIRSGRRERARRMGEALAAAGIPGAFEGALRHAGNPDLVSRTHFARWLVEAGHFAETHEVFRHYLASGKPGHVPHDWARLGDAVRWINEAGGVAVIAHPARYRFSPSAEYALFSEFVAHGGRGVEVITGSHTTAEQLQYADTALEFGLLASRGSDFHSPAESRVDLGTLPDLPGRLTPVWGALAARVQRA
ncbi:phosphatase [Rubrivivax gelatinosus]|nr:phosphatase [Rubrivivax gelatinosus]